MRLRLPRDSYAPKNGKRDFQSSYEESGRDCCVVEFAHSHDEPVRYPRNHLPAPRSEDAPRARAEIHRLGKGPAQAEEGRRPGEGPGSWHRCRETISLTVVRFSRCSPAGIELKAKQQPGRVAAARRGHEDV